MANAESYFFLLRISLNISLGAFYYGYMTTYFNAIPYPKMIQIFSFSGYPEPLTQGLLTGSISFTAAFGALLSYFLLQKLSRYRCLLLISFSGAITSLLSLIAHPILLILIRLIQGLMVGVLSTLNSIYLRQFLPKELIGKLWMIHQLVYTLGIGSSFFMVSICSRGFSMEAQEYWRIVFIVSCLVASTQFFILLTQYQYQTPKFLISIGQFQEARKLLRNIYRQDNIEDYFQEIFQNYKQRQTEIEMREFSRVPSQTPQKSTRSDHISSLMERLTQNLIEPKNEPIQLKNNTLALICAWNLAITFQFYGQPAIIQYSSQIAQKTFPQMWDTLPIIVSVAGSTGGCLAIFVIGRFGRRQIILTGGMCSIISSTVISLCFACINTLEPEESSFILRLIVCVGSIVLRLAMAITIGPISWLVISQIVQPNVVPFTSFIMWIGYSAISVFYPVVCRIPIDQNPYLAYLGFTVIGAIGFTINKLYLVETSGKSQWEIRTQFEKKWQ